MDFDTPLERRGTNSAKWDRMEATYGIPAKDGIPMWVADMDFATAPVVRDAVIAMAEGSRFTYAATDDAYRQAICWWMRERHGWNIEPEAIFTTNGLVNAVSLILMTYTAPGDGVVLMTPVYHAFAKAVRQTGRSVVECPLGEADGRYALDIEAWSAAMTGTEKVLILCSPHNPGGRIWTPEELRAIAGFAAAHDLLIIADEVHQDLVYPGQTHTPFLVAAPEAAGRTLVLNAPSKTFNIAGGHCGQVIVPDPALRETFAAQLTALSLAPSSIGQEMTRAAYSPEGAAWVDEVCAYLDGNRIAFAAAIDAIPGLRLHPMQATYLAWVDFSGTGMAPAEIIERVEKGARIAANHGAVFGSGGEYCLRFNLAMRRELLDEATARLAAAFADLQ